MLVIHMDFVNNILSHVCYIVLHLQIVICLFFNRMKCNNLNFRRFLIIENILIQLMRLLNKVERRSWLNIGPPCV